MPSLDLARSQLLTEVIPELDQQLGIFREHNDESHGLALADQTESCIAAIQALCDSENATDLITELERLAAQASQPRFSFTHMGSCTDWPSELHSQLISLAREAFQNTQKHARASECKALLIVNDQQVTFTISDNGKGIKEDASGFGLSSAKAWAEKHGGTLTATTLPDSGTTIGLILPLADYRPSEFASGNRQSFAKTLHDDVCQSLTGLTLLTATLRDATPESDTTTWQRLRASTNAFKAATATCRALSHSLAE